MPLKSELKSNGCLSSEAPPAVAEIPIIAIPAPARKIETKSKGVVVEHCCAINSARLPFSARSTAPTELRVTGPAMPPPAGVARIVRNTSVQAEALPIVCNHNNEDLLELRILQYIDKLKEELEHSRIDREQAARGATIVPIGAAQDVQAAQLAPPTQPQSNIKDVVQNHYKNLTKYDRDLLMVLATSQTSLGLAAEAIMKAKVFTIYALIGVPSAQLFVSILGMFIFFIFDKPDRLDPPDRWLIRKWVARPVTKYSLLLFFIAIISLGLNLAIIFLEDVKVIDQNDTTDDKNGIEYNRVPPILLAFNYIFIVGVSLIIPLIVPLLNKFDLFAANDYISDLKKQIEELQKELNTKEVLLIRAEHATKAQRSQLFSEIISLNERLQKVGSNADEIQQYKKRLINLHDYSIRTHKCHLCCHVAPNAGIRSVRP